MIAPDPNPCDSPSQNMGPTKSRPFSSEEKTTEPSASTTMSLFIFNGSPFGVFTPNEGQLPSLGTMTPKEPFDSRELGTWHGPIHPTRFSPAGKPWKHPSWDEETPERGKRPLLLEQMLLFALDLFPWRWCSSFDTKSKSGTPAEFFQTPLHPRHMPKGRRSKL